MLFTGAALLLSWTHVVCADEFKLIESFPADGQTVARDRFLDGSVYFILNRPLDVRISKRIIKIHLLDEPSSCQLTICGRLFIEDRATLITWYPNAYQFQDKTRFQFELGAAGNEFDPPILLTDIYGNEMEPTTIDFEIEACDPLGIPNLYSSGNGRCPHQMHPVGYYTVTKGELVRGMASLTNPVCAGVRSVEVKTWVEFPDGRCLPIENPHTTIEMSEGRSIAGELFRYTFTGMEIEGRYAFGLTLMNPITGEIYSSRTRFFQFSLCR
ncbi:MAG: hypothetical protein GY859_10835 [Desulfobacterales bacterium]|nr:hypothetical protein [Desulfobacterales bacterium]